MFHLISALVRDLISKAYLAGTAKTVWVPDAKTQETKLIPSQSEVFEHKPLATLKPPPVNIVQSKVTTTPPRQAPFISVTVRFPKARSVLALLRDHRSRGPRKLEAVIP